MKFCNHKPLHSLTRSLSLSLSFSCSQAHTHTKQIKLTQRCAPLHSSSRYFAEKVMRTLLHSHSFPNTRSHTPAHSRTYELSRTCASCRILRRFHFRVTSSPFINISRKKNSPKVGSDSWFGCSPQESRHRTVRLELGLNARLSNL